MGLKRASCGLLHRVPPLSLPAMPVQSASIVQSLAALIGQSAVVAEPARMAAFLDEPRKRFHQNAVAIALPADVEQVQTIARWANENRVPLIPQGGNTGL